MISYLHLQEKKCCTSLRFVCACDCVVWLGVHGNVFKKWLHVPHHHLLFISLSFVSEASSATSSSC